MKLSASNLVITGASQGIGKSIALRLAQQGANLALLDVNADALQEVASACQSAGSPKALALTCNVAREQDVIDTFATIAQSFDRLDGLINNAGITRDGMLLKVKDGKIDKRMALDQWQQVIDVNLTGVFLCGREAASIMALQANDDAAIINLASISRAGNVGQSNYAAAKAGVEALTVTWAKELARYKIRAMAIAPGFVETEMTQSMKPEALDLIRMAVPLGRMGQPDHIAQTAQFILENDYLSGRTIEVDAGLRI
ncbi:SDR family oxidoreductase [Simiduia aestuariiviva]|uniref:3-oxoacyl-[acyl-carrier protein] reductase n=1 Tax=Simiduia aestuariiviva TaxID=1510459 RepID=A0A839URH2_9GAMM|nr:SDR family oxidoreductase [Simiduia aestuariiviva]MBB3169069.1 3-oxoacyl-[acyl-carrier protein] reductase [Simiduia aestuariiviva]